MKDKIQSVNSHFSNKETLFYLAFWLALVFGSALRLANLGSDSMILDEAQSVWQASHNINYIVSYMVQNVHLPLHNTLLHYWIMAFGTSERSVRLLSAIPGILILPVLYLLAKEVFNSKSKAFLAYLIGVVSPFWIWYSREIRMYTLLTLIAALSYYFYLKVLKKATFFNLVFYTLINIVGVYTHYFFIFVLLTQALFFFIAWKNGWYKQLAQYGGRILIYFFMSFFVLMLVFSPWIVYFLKFHTSNAFSPQLDKPSSFNLVLSFFEFTMGYQPDYVTAAIIAFWPVFVLIGFIFLAKRKNPLSPGIYLAFLGVFLPMVIVYLVSIFFYPIYLTRYLMSGTPLLIILIAWLLTELQGNLKTIFIGIFFIAVLMAIHNQRVNTDNPETENYRAAVQYVRNNATYRDIVVVAPPYTLYPVYYYYDLPNKLVSMPIWDERSLAIPQITQTKLQQDSSYIQQGHQRIFLITTLDLNGGYAVENYMDYHYTRLAKTQFSKFVWVDVYQAEYPSKPTTATTAK